MPSCFYNLSGLMQSKLDVHFYVPPLPVPKPPSIPWPHETTCAFIGESVPGEKIVASVTMDALPVLQKGFMVEYLQHYPIAGPILHPLEVVELGIIYVTSSSEAYLSVMRVSAGGAPIAACDILDWGTNINCSEPVSLPVGKVHNPNTVQTQVTADDKLAARIDYLTYLSVSGLYHRYIGKKMEKVAKKLEPYVDKLEKIIKPKLPDFIKDNLADPISKYTKDALEPISDALRDKLGEKAGEKAGDEARDKMLKDLPEK